MQHSIGLGFGPATYRGLRSHGCDDALGPVTHRCTAWPEVNSRDEGSQVVAYGVQLLHTPTYLRVNTHS